MEQDIRNETPNTTRSHRKRDAKKRRTCQGQDQIIHLKDTTEDSQETPQQLTAEMKEKLKR